MISPNQKEQIKAKIQANKHEVFIVSVEQMDAIVNNAPQGKQESAKKAWVVLRDKLNRGASYYATADDAVTLTKLVGDLGGLGVRAYIKTYAGKPHIILKGRPGLRTILTGTRYGIQNPKVISMGLGKAGAIKAAKTGGILTIVLLTTFRVADYFLTDQATLTQLIGTLATDVVKVGISVGASIALASYVTGTTVTTLAIGPLVAVIGMGLLVSLALDGVDSQFGITKKVIAGLDELENSIKQNVNHTKAGVQRTVSEAVNSAIDYVVDSTTSFVVNWAKHRINRYYPIGIR
ncbi:hypothetical protein [Teredinibacter sp. KSP-S5-2]|uniref:hypothetical protein n=1 Tax=Teredinibacter sp. KSP-S5-2 TaxID=3034506 RepID=UPI002934EF8C|nr:hypothetical protein [Teredinibacter sp. KSP-S5-2]WNO08045.1 hypothetical protein P5V12_13770 [Teredinibacter sp. KSP-S5-2]